MKTAWFLFVLAGNAKIHLRQREYNLLSLSFQNVLAVWITVNRTSHTKFYSHLGIFCFHFLLSQNSCNYPVGWERAVEYSDCNSIERKDISQTTSVLDKSLHYLMVKFQSWSFREFGVPLSLPLLPGPLLSIRVPSMCWIKLFNHLLNLNPFNYVQRNDEC